MTPRCAGACARAVAGVAVLAGLATAGLAQPADPAWQLSLQTDRHSDALPLAAWGSDDWRALRPRSGRNLAYVDDQLRLQRRQAAWTWGLVARNQATLVASQRTLELTALLDQGQQPAQPQAWPVHMRLRAFSGAGVSLGWEGGTGQRWAQALAAATGGQWQAGLSAELLALGRWRDRDLAGAVSHGGGGSGGYGFALQSDEHDHRLDLPFQQAPARRGSGLLLGATLQWQAAGWALRGAVADGGWLHWQGQPRQQLVLDSDTLGIDADGFLQYRPLLTGRNSQAARTDWQRWRASVAVQRQIDAHSSLALSVRQWPGAPMLPAVHWRQQQGALQWGLGWQLHERRATVDLAWRGWQLRVGADRLGAGAHSRNLALVWHAPLP